MEAVLTNQEWIKGVGGGGEGRRPLSLKILVRENNFSFTPKVVTRLGRKRGHSKQNQLLTLSSLSIRTAREKDLFQH